MLRALFFFVKVAIVVAIAVWLADRPGEVLIEWQGYVVETTVGMLVLAVAVVAVVAALLYAGFRALRRAPAGFMQRRRLRRRERGYRALTLGMVAVAAGDPDEARRQAKRADVLLNEPPLTMLLAAQSAQLDGDSAAAQRYFTEMLDRPETAFLGLRGLLMQAQREGDLDRAIALAERANRQRPGTPWVLETLFDLQVHAGRWADAERTLESIEKHKLLPRETARHRRAVVYVERAREEAHEGQARRALTLIQEAHRLDPQLVPATVELARLEVAEGKPRRAEKAIFAAWRAGPHPALARAFADLHADLSPAERYKRFERLADENPGHRESKLALAEAAIDAELWSEARRHLMEASRPEPSARVCRLMAEVERREHGDTEAARIWLERAADAEPDPTWVARDSGVVVDEWSAVPAAGGGFDSLEWRAPERARPLTLRSPLVLSHPVTEIRDEPPP